MRRFNLTLQTNEELARERDSVSVGFEALKKSTPGLLEILELVDTAHEACTARSAMLKGPSPAELMDIVDEVSEAFGT